MRTVLALLVVVATAVLAPAAEARIVPQRGIAGVAIGMSQAQVRAVLGKPVRVVRGANDFGPYVDFHYSRLRVSFQGRERVTFITTTRRGERTRTGVGVGSTQRQVLRGVSGAKCGVQTANLCAVGQFLPGRRVTVFFIRAGRVFRVDVGIVVD